MPILMLQNFFLLSLISAIVCLTNFGHASDLCQDDQKRLLLELKNDLTFDSSVSTKLVRWKQTDDCCEWEGVGCDAAGHVVRLQLDYEGISGGVENSSGLVSLEYLEKLNLAHNSLNGSIPILNLSNLIELDLSSNQLKDPISDSFHNLECLEVLSLSDNLFNDTFQLENIQSLHNLTTLNLSHNNLSLDASSINSNWSRFSKLKKLSLSSCNLQKFPDFLKQSNLNFLDLSDNQIAGEIPSWIWEIGNGGLYHLNLSYNLLVDLQKPYHIPNFLSELDLHSNQLRGELPLLPRGATYVDFSNNKFEKTIPLCFVSSNSLLIFLSIAINNISGSIPTCICSAESIQVLDLSFNKLSGSIPPCLVERMSSLQMLILRENNLSGDIPDKFPTRCGLRMLNLFNNNLGGNFPKSLGNCKSLEFVNVRSNFIEDSFSCMLPSRLKILLLGSNKFVGEVRCGRNWPNLQVIDISSNRFSGALNQISFSNWKRMILDREIVPDEDLKYMKHRRSVPPGFSYLDIIDRSTSTSITVVDFSCNNFQGVIPEVIGDLRSLRYLNLSHNALTGRIPKSFGNMSENLELLDLSVNQLRGELPLLPRGASYVDFSHNNFDKPIPLSFVSSNLHLIFLSMTNNSISGSIPTSFCSADSIQVLDLSLNNLSGSIPPCLVERMSNLQLLNLRSNNISGDIPDKYSTNCAMRILVLNNNNLEGNFPKSLGNCKSLELVNVGENKIEGSFPCMLGSRLKFLVLRSNRFGGEVKCGESWPNLQVIDISSNNFSGGLHHISFPRWNKMVLERDAYPDFYYSTWVTLTHKGYQMELTRLWAYFSSVDFSCNNFQGEIPEAIGDLSMLNVLNLSHNALTGRIPKSFGNMSDLESLDLSVNQLMETIPVELTRLTFLSKLNLSYNNLVGRIPSYNQFSTFENDSFIGNAGLCGSPLTLSCIEDSPKHENKQPSAVSEMKGN